MIYKIKVVEFQISSSYHWIMSYSRYTALFGCNLKVVLTTLNWHLDVLKIKYFKEIYSQHEEDSYKQENQLTLL